MASTAFVSGQRNEDGALDHAVLNLFPHDLDNQDFRTAIYSHARRLPMEKAHVTFYSTWFLDGNVHVPMGTIIGDDGRVNAFARSRWQKLPNVNLPFFMTTVRTLRETIRSVALANVVIVSFRLNGQWETRLYDRSKPPKELVNIYRIARSRLDVH